MKKEDEEEFLCASALACKKIICFNITRKNRVSFLTLHVVYQPNSSD